MACRNLHITRISAKDLKNVSLFGKMDVYAVVSISVTPQKLRTHVYKRGGPNPTWYFPMGFTVDDSLTLVVKIKAIGFFTNWNLGEVHVPIKELMERDSNTVSYRVRRPSGKLGKGEVSFSYEYGEKVSVLAFRPPPPPPPLTDSTESRMGFGIRLLAGMLSDDDY